LCFRCLGEGHLGQSCFCTRVCGLDECQEVHHRLLHQQTNKSLGASLNGGKHAKDTDKMSQQRKTMKSDQGIPAGKKATPTTEGRLQLRMMILH